EGSCRSASPGSAAPPQWRSAAPHLPQSLRSCRCDTGSGQESASHPSMYNIPMAMNPALPFTSFHLTRHRAGGVAGINQTTELQWERETGAITCRWPGGEHSSPADRPRVAALWQRLEALGFWEWRPPWRGLLEKLFD